MAQLSHHVRSELCFSRARYRQGRKDTAIKVYTVSQESYFLLLQNVPSLDISEELRNLCETFGKVESFSRIQDYPREAFTEVFLVKYRRLQEARIAKKQLDDRSFFGGNLHVCYSPEYESVQNTREKLKERQRIVTSYIRLSKNPNFNFNQSRVRRANVQNESIIGPVRPIPGNIIKEKQVPQTVQNSQSQTNNNEERISSEDNPQTYIWAGKEYPINSNQTEISLQEKKMLKLCQSKSSDGQFLPRQLKITPLKETVPLPSLTNANKRKLDSLRVPNQDVSLSKRKMQSNNEPSVT